MITGKERRKHRRFQVPGNTFVGIGPYFDNVGRMVDISMGGVAFRYVGTEEPSQESSIYIFSSDHDFYLGNIPFKTVADFEIVKKAPSRHVTMRQAGLKFKKLTDNQISRLKYFIQNCALREAA